MRELSSSSHACSTYAVHRGDVNPLAKALIALALVVPLVTYVAGTLASTGSSVPEQQGTVYVNDLEPSPATTPKPSPSRPSPTRDNQPTPSPDDDADDNEARVVTPAPVQDDDERDDDDDGDDTDHGDDTDD